MTRVQSQQEDMKSETLTQEEALELATVLKQKLSDGELPNKDLESINKMVAGLGDNRGELRLTFAVDFRSSKGFLRSGRGRPRSTEATDCSTP